MRSGMLGRVLTTKEQFILVGVAVALCVGSIALFLTRSPASPDAAAPEPATSAPKDVAATPDPPVLPPPPESPQVEAALEPHAGSESPKPVAVAVAGAVATPGVYTLAPGARVKDLIEAAGGLLDEADVSDINRAAQLIDGSTLTVPAGAHAAVEGDRLVVRGAPRQIVVNPRVYTISGWKYDHAVSGPIGIERGVSATDGSGDASPASNLVDINSASQEQLETLPGIGPVKAQNIINYRQQTPFRSVDELESVDGIGPITLEKLRPLVTASGS